MNALSPATATFTVYIAATLDTWVERAALIDRDDIFTPQ